MVDTRTYIVGAVEREECVRRQHLATGREGMAYLEERIYGKTLVQLGAQAREGLVLEEHAPLHLLGDFIHGAGIRQT